MTQSARTGPAVGGPPQADEYVWLQRVTSWPLAALVAAGVVVELVRGHRSAAQTALSVASLVVAGTALTTVRVVAGSDGLTVGLGPWGWPSRHIPASRIRAAHVENTSPLAYGGWGLRWRPGKVRIIIRRGPSLVVDLTDGTSFGVTTKDAEQAVRLLDPATRQ